MYLNLELWEINLILNALGERPYQEVAHLIGKIREQVEKEE